ncbi:MAG: DnaJ domain-containing protein [Burkholderiaceae bacterium]|nr:DnaJ domain-containing protein [Burkholderiaceae bacterium]
MEFKDYYATLAVPHDADADQIKKAFRKLARKYHPDVSKEPNAELRMKEINEANAVLSDPEKRAAYDALGSGHAAGEDFRPPPNWDAGFEFSKSGFSDADAAQFSEFFSELFGGIGAARGAADRRGAAARGEDHHAKVLLDIEDAWRGAEQRISLRVPKIDERGRVVLESRTLDVQIPAGVREGQLIRLAGQGGPGFGSGPAGDLYLEVHFKPHPRYRIDGRDLVVELPIAPWEAALGAVVSVERPDGASLKTRVPPGAQTAGQLVLRGKGVPADPPGDLIVNLRVVVPPADTPKAKELYETMAREMNFDPRAVGGA